MALTPTFFRTGVLTGHALGLSLACTLAPTVALAQPVGLHTLHPNPLVSDRPPALQACDPLPDTERKPGRHIGVALAGGGSKAAAFSMGVLTGLSERQAFKEVGAISSVSGGSYAAFFLFSKWMIDLEGRQGQAVDPLAQRYFEDCIPLSYQRYLSPHARAGLAPRYCAFDLQAGRLPQTDAAAGVPPFQPFVRCRQDVLEGDCNFESVSEDRTGYLHALALAGVTLATAVPNLVTRTLFDMPLNYAPTRLAYRDGIGTAYGLYPTSARAYTQASLAEACTGGNAETPPERIQPTAFKNCQARDSFVRMRTDGMTFQRLHEAYQASADMPAWVLQATSSPNRSLFGWAGVNQQNFDRYVLSMSPFAQCSGQFGNVRMPSGQSNSAVDGIGSQLDLLDAVNASAAFLDANQVKLPQPGRLLAALGLHALNLDWGIDIRNNLAGSTGRGHVHSALPFPLYYLDSLHAAVVAQKPSNERSAYIRVIDGGNSDDLGAYTLIKAGYATVIISDHSGDADGTLEDLCRLAIELPRRSTRLHLRLPGLQDFDAGCAHQASLSEPDEAAGKEAPFHQTEAAPPPPHRYPIWAWAHPVLLGCLVSDAAQPACACTPAQAAQGACQQGAWHAAQRVIVIKPAFDMAAFAHEQLDEAGLLRDCGEHTQLPCEAASYVLSRGPLSKVAHAARSLPEGEPLPASAFKGLDFPQHSTVLSTFNSSAYLYGAYKDLGAHLMKQAWTRAQWPDADFAREVAAQAAKPVRSATAAHP